MNSRHPLILLFLFSLFLPLRAQNGYTPEKGTPERAAICDGLREFIIAEYAEKKLPKPILLNIEFMKVEGDYCFVEYLPVFADGADAVPQYLPDIGYTHCLKQFNVGWHVILDLSRTDVPDRDEVKKIRKTFPGDFPVSILPKFWQDLFHQHK